MNRENLSGRYVFLSAGFPSPERNLEFYKTADPFEITQSVLSLVRAVFASNGRLVFGGHPTISPLVLMVAEEYLPTSLIERKVWNEKNGYQVTIYQSEAFREHIPESTKRLFEYNLGQIIWTPKADMPSFTSMGTLKQNTSAESIRIMRDKIMDTNPVAAICIGGMEGIIDESDLFRNKYPNRPIYFIGAPGGAARTLIEKNAEKYSEISMLTKEEIASSQNYPSLMQRIVMDIICLCD